MQNHQQPIAISSSAAQVLSRRRFLTGVAMSAGAAVLGACGGSGKTTDTPAPTKAQPAAAVRASAPVEATTAVGSASASRTQAAMAIPKAYIGLFKDNAVAVFDTMTSKVRTTIPIPTGPHGLVLTPDGKTVYASSDGATVVSVIDTATDTVTASIEVGQAPHGLAITPDGKTVLVAGFGTNQVMVIDAATNTVAGQVAVPQPHNIAIAPDGKTAYVAAQQQGATALVILNLAEKQQVGSVALEKTPRAVNFDMKGAQLYFTLAGVDAVQVLDVATNKVTGQIAVGASPHHPLITTTGEYGLVVSQGPGELAIWTPDANKVVGTVKVGMMPHWIAASADGDTAYVTNEASNDLTIINVETQKVIATVPVGNAPRKIVLQAGMVMPPAVAPAAIVSTAPASSAAVPAPATAGANGVSIASFAFVPQSITVAPGQTVMWTNKDSTPHTVTADKGDWDSKSIAVGATFQHKFDQAGIFMYHCAIHPFMTGSVVVKG